MNNGQEPGIPPKKRRGRPPGKHTTSSQHVDQQIAPSSANGELPATSIEIAPPSETISFIDKNAYFGQEQTRQTSFSRFLYSILHNERTEITRVARELEVAENTIYRWMKGSSDRPRPTHLKKLPTVLPEYRTQLITVINQCFDNILDVPLPGIREIDKEIYYQVLELNAANDDNDNRFWHVSQTIFEHILHHIDADQKGMAVTYATLMSPHNDGIHSLREVVIRGSYPWQSSVADKAFLGNTTLAGSAAIHQRFQVWNNLDGDYRNLIEIDHFEQSSCAVPIIRGTTIAGVLIVSSTQSSLFRDPTVCNIVAEYALLMNIALNPQDFYPFSLLNLRPMPDLRWQRSQIASTYTQRIIAIAHKCNVSRNVAEFQVQHDMELEFELVARATIEQKQTLSL